MRPHRRSVAVTAAALASAAALLAGCTSGDQGSVTQSPSTATMAPGPSVLPSVPTGPAPSSSSPAPTGVSPTTPDSVPPQEGPTRPAGWTAPTGSARPTSSTRPSPTRGRFVTDIDPALRTVQVVPASDTKRKAQLIKDLCDSGVANVQCIFTPTGPLEHVLGPMKRTSSEPYQMCRGTGFQEIAVKDTTDSTDDVGGKLSVRIGNIVGAGFEFSFGHIWTNSHTTTVKDRMEVQEYTIGYAYRAAPMLRATGEMFIRETGAIVPGADGPQWYAYRLLSLSYDTPDTTVSGNGTLDLVTRPMTPAEKATCPPTQRRSGELTTKTPAKPAVRPSAAERPAPTTAVRPQAEPPDVFSFRNLTDRPLVVTDVRVQDNQVWSGAFGGELPYPGQVIQTGQVVYTDLTFTYNGPGGAIVDNKAWIDFTIGVGGPLVHAMVYNNGKGWPFHQTAFTCASTDPSWTCGVDGYGHGADIYLTHPTDITVPSSDPNVQHRLMEAMCQPGNAAVHCDFTKTQNDLEHVTIPYAQLGDLQYNYTDRETEHSWTEEWEQGTAWRVGGEFSPLNIHVEKIIDVELAATYEHEWGSSHADEVTNGVYVKPGEVGWIERQVPALQAVGNLRVGVGNQWWTLQGVTFVTPNSDGSTFGWVARGNTRPMTRAELDARPTPPDS